MTDPNLFDISRDDELLDALAGRPVSDETVADLRTDPLFVDLSLWTAQIDFDAAAARASSTVPVEDVRPREQDGRRSAGRHRRNSTLGRAGRRSVRAGVAFAAAGTALSFSGVAAAVNGGHLPQLTSFHFPTAGPPVKGSTVLSDVPSAVPTSPGAHQERTQQVLPPIQGAEDLELPRHQDKAQGSAHAAHPDAHASHGDAAKPAKPRTTPKATTPPAPVTKPKPSVSRLPHVETHPAAKAGSHSATSHRPAPKHAKHPAHSKTSVPSTPHTGVPTPSMPKPSNPSTKPGKSAGKHHGSRISGPMRGHTGPGSQTPTTPGSVTKPGQPEQGSSGADQHSGKTGVHHKGKHTSGDATHAKTSHADKAGARRVITQAAGGPQAGTWASSSSAASPTDAATAPTASGADTVTPSSAEAVTPPTQEK